MTLAYLQDFFSTSSFLAARAETAVFKRHQETFSRKLRTGLVLLIVSECVEMRPKIARPLIILLLLLSSHAKIEAPIGGRRQQQHSQGPIDPSSPFFLTKSRSNVIPYYDSAAAKFLLPPSFSA